MLSEKASLFSTRLAIGSVTLTSTDVNGVTIDTQGFNSLWFTVNVGANGGTLNGSNKVDFELQHGDASDLSDAVNVTSVGDTGGYTIDNNGAWATVDAGGEASAVYKVAYTGSKRYVRLVADITGTISLPVSATAILGDGLAPQA
jgi:hypothetical protein